MWCPGPVRVTTAKNSKRCAGQLAFDLGSAVPMELATFPGPAAVDLAGLPDRFVLKATNLASKRGVFLIERRGDDRYFDRFTASEYSADQIRAALTEALLAGERPLNTPILVEEFIVGANGPAEIPFDYKCYTFDGQVELVIQFNRNSSPTGVAFFDRDFRPLERHHTKLSRAVQFVEHVKPDNWQEILDTASRVSLHLGVPFISVDMYTTGQKVIFGELTPRPGAAYYGMWRFSDEFDSELGAYYRQAYRRRGATIPIVEGLPPVLEKHEAVLRRNALAAQDAPNAQIALLRKQVKALQRDLRRARAPSVRTSAKLLQKAILKRIGLGRSDGGERQVTKRVHRP